jgi:catechol 2,3-dioxygenase-like lactoylglutathione lyase family enzyme
MAADGILGLDHVSLPMRDTEPMLAFYRALGCDIDEQRSVVSVYAGKQMINFHRPQVWPHPGFTLRAPQAVPPCGDLCFEWRGSSEALHARLVAAGASIEEGPVARHGARRAEATSVYTRDPDGNLLEFMIYPAGGGDGA